METQEAITILEQAVNAAVLKGVYNLTDVNSIINALNTIKSKSN